MKADHADVFARSQPHIFPGLTAIAALIYSIAVGHTSVIVLACAHPYLVAVMRIDGHTSRRKTLLPSKMGVQLVALFVDFQTPEEAVAK